MHTCRCRFNLDAIIGYSNSRSEPSQGATAQHCSRLSCLSHTTENSSSQALVPEVGSKKDTKSSFALHASNLAQ